MERVNDIMGWGLKLFHEDREKLEELGRIQDVGSAYGCMNPQCNCLSHSPAAPMRRWIPYGDLYYLGSEEKPYERLDAYYLLQSRHHEDICLQLVEPRWYHASLYIFGPEEIPDWVLVNLGRCDYECD